MFSPTYAFHVYLCAWRTLFPVHHSCAQGSQVPELSDEVAPLDGAPISPPTWTRTPNPLSDRLIPSSERGPTATEDTDPNPKVGRKFTCASLILFS